MRRLQALFVFLCTSCVCKVGNEVTGMESSEKTGMQSDPISDVKAAREAKGIRLSTLAWAAALLPLATIHLSFITSVAEGVFPVCNPYWIDCTSISHGGRHGSAYFLFKAGMMPTALLLALFWVLQARWLTQGHTSPHWPLSLVGLIGSIALIVYTLFLFWATK